MLTLLLAVHPDPGAVDWKRESTTCNMVCKSSMVSCPLCTCMNLYEHRLLNQYSTKFVMDPPSLYPYTWSAQAQVMPHAGQLARVLTRMQRPPTRLGVHVQMSELSQSPCRLHLYMTRTGCTHMLNGSLPRLTQKSNFLPVGN